MNNWNSDNIKAMEKFITIANRGGRINGAELTKVYNDVLNKKLTPTSCGSCIRSRYKDLKQSYDNFLVELKKQEEKAKALQVIHDFMMPTPEELEVMEAFIPDKENFLMDEEKEEITPKRGRKKKGD